MLHAAGKLANVCRTRIPGRVYSRGVPVRRLLLALAVISSSCSLVFTRGPKTQRMPVVALEAPECTDSMFVPAVDALLAGGFAVLAAFGIGTASDVDDDDFLAPLDYGFGIMFAVTGIAGALVYGASAVAGRSRVVACRESLERYDAAVQAPDPEVIRYCSRAAVCEGRQQCIAGRCTWAGREGEACIPRPDLSEHAYACERGLTCVDEVCVAH